MNKKEIHLFGQAFNGKTPSKDEQRSEGLPILKIRDIDENGQFRGNFESFVEPVFYQKHAKKKLKTGDTIILNAAHNSDYVGSKNAFIPSKLEGVIATGEWLIVRVNEAHPAYVNQFLKSPSGRKSLKKNVKGIHLYPKDVERIKIPLPPLDDQIRIAHLLGKVEGLIAQRKQHLQQLDDLLKSVFLEMFGDPVRNEKGWQKKCCSDVTDVLTGHPFKSDLYIDDNTQVKLCGGLIIYPNKIEWGKCNYWSRKNLSGLERYLLKYEDIVLAMDRPWISSGLKVCAVGKTGEDSLLVQRTARLRGVGIEQLFLYAHLKDASFTKHCKPTETTVPHISIKDIQTFKVILPPKELQIDFSDFARNVEVLKSNYLNSLLELENLYGTLSQKAFKGELDISRVPLVDKVIEETTEEVFLSHRTEGSHVIPEMEYAHIADFIDQVSIPPPSSLSDNPNIPVAWVDAYIDHVKTNNTVLNVPLFIEVCSQKWNEMFQFSSTLPASEAYDNIKKRLFQKLESMELMQNYDDKENKISLSITKQGK